MAPLSWRDNEATLAIGRKRWWLGGGWDVLQFNPKTPGWPTTIAWFREEHHARAFVRLFGINLPGEPK